MWAFLVLTLALSVRASDTNNDTAAEEKLVIARGKLLVSADRNTHTHDMASFKIPIQISCHDHKMFRIAKRTGDTVTALSERMGRGVR